jgi:cell division protein FtsL
VFVELEREQARARQYDVEYGQLSLEQSTWGMPARVEKIARESLRMQLPASSRVEIVEAPAAAKPGDAAPASASVAALAPAAGGALR